MGTSPLTKSIEHLRDQSDAELIARFRVGEEAAFDEIYRRYLPLVQSVCRRGSPGTAADAMQETFLRLVGALPRLDEPDSLPAYISRTARSACIDLGRRRRPDVLPVDPQRDLPDVADTSPGPDEVTEFDVTARAVLGGVRPVEAALLEAHHGQGVPLEELAQRFGSTPGAVAVRLHRARQRALKFAQANSLRGALPVGALFDAVRRVTRRLGTVREVGFLTGLAPLAIAAAAVITTSPPAPADGLAPVLQARERSQAAANGAPETTARTDEHLAALRVRRSPRTREPTPGPQDATRASARTAVGSRRDHDTGSVDGVEVPLAGTSIKRERPPGKPDYAVGVDVRPNGAEEHRVHARVETHDVPEADPVMNVACAVGTAASPVTYCEKN